MEKREKAIGEKHFEKSFSQTFFKNLSVMFIRSFWERWGDTFFQKNIFQFSVFLIFLAFPCFAQDDNVFHVNRRAEISFSENAISLTYAIEISDVPAIEEIRTADADGNGEVDETEKKIYFLALAKRVMDGFRITVSNQPIGLKLQSMQGDFLTTSEGKKRVKADFLATAFLTSEQGSRVTVVDAVFSDKIGMREIRIAPLPGWKIVGDGEKDDKGKIRFHGPTGIGPWSINFVLEKVILPIVVSTKEEAAKKEPLDGKARIEELLDESRVPIIVLAVIVAFIVGVFHSLTPGHGRDMLSAYLVGSRGTLKHAALFGWIVTAIRTTPVFSMGIVIVLLDLFLLPDTLRVWLKILCAIGVIAIGIGVTIWNFVGNISSDRPLPIGISLSELVGLCIMSSLIPSPSAIALLLGASSAGYSLLGLGLVVAFGFGLQAMMTLNGYMALRFSHLSDRIDEIIERNQRTPMMWGIIILFAGIVLLAGNL